MLGEYYKFERKQTKNRFFNILYISTIITAMGNSSQEAR